MRALLELPTAPRRAELAQALGYWTARHHPLPAHPSPHGGAAQRQPWTPSRPALPERLWAPTYEAAWAVTAAIITIYRPSTPPPRTAGASGKRSRRSRSRAIAIATGDEHAIKFVEVAQESHHRGNSHALAAGARASHFIAPVDYDD